MTPKKKSYPTVQFGTSLMLVVFLILTLTAFATLSLSGALRDYEYSKKAAQKTSAFYHADLLANQKLVHISDVLEQIFVKYPDAYETHALLELRNMDDVIVSDDETNPWIAYKIPINTRQNLEVQLSLSAPAGKDQPYYRVVRWQETPAAPWAGETKLPVLGSQ